MASYESHKFGNRGYVSSSYGMCPTITAHYAKNPDEGLIGRVRE